MTLSFDQLKKPFSCACGRRHEVPVQEIVYSEKAVADIPRAIGPLIAGRTAAVVSDERTYGIAGAEVVSTLSRSGWLAESTVVPDRDGLPPRCDDITADLLKSAIGNPDLFVAVGSGVINDLTKWVSHEKETPYLVVATAASMNGYTAANVAATLKGVKQLLRAHAPMFVFARPSVIEQAPFAMTASGLGDAVAKSVSIADWRMNRQLFGEHFCPFCAEIIAEIEPIYFNQPGKVRNRTPEGVRAVFDALIYSGLAMTLIGTSAPASGGEHLLSHTLDMMHLVDRIPHDLHGRQVGIGTVFAAALHQRLQSMDHPEWVPMPERIDRGFWKHLADPVAAQYEAKQKQLERARDGLRTREKWRQLLAQMAEGLRTPEQIGGCLAAAGAARYIDDIGCSRDRARAALLHMHEIRARFTVVDLAWMAGILPDAVEDIMAEWLVR